MGKKDNSTLTLKVSLRRRLLKEIESPVVLETHGGKGHVWRKCYAGLPTGVVIEKEPERAEFLARQRPGWAVYEADCVSALRDGLGSHLPVNFVDVDPYGEPWPALDALFESERDWPPVLALAVNDGLRQMLRISGGWNIKSMQPLVARYGNDYLFEHYLEVCRELVTEKAAQVGYTLHRWRAYYCGLDKRNLHNTHYGAVLVK